jgi:hypothetical protein
MQLLPNSQLLICFDSNEREPLMMELLKSLRRPPGEHRDVFAEFAVLMAFVVAEQLVSARHKPRLRVVK